MIRIGVIYWNVDIVAGLPSYVHLETMPRVGETISFEDIARRGPNDIVGEIRIRWFTVKGVGHHIGIAPNSFEQGPASVTLYVEPKNTITGGGSE